MEDRNGNPIKLDDLVKVYPRTTDFDRPSWTMGERCIVAKFGRTRVHCNFVDVPGYSLSFRPYDLLVLPPEADA